MATVDDAVPELGGKRAELGLLRHAWHQRDLFLQNARSALRTSDFLHVSIILLTFLTVFATVVKNDASFPKSAELDSVLNYVVIVFPLMASLFMAINGKLSPGSKWGALTLAGPSSTTTILG